MENNKTPPGRLVRKSDFARLKKYGVKAQLYPWLILKALPSKDGTSKLGWTIPARAGSAVTRNRIKRWCREYFRNHAGEVLKVALDINVIVLGVPRNPDFLKRMEYDEFKKNLEKTYLKILRNQWNQVPGDFHSA